VLCAPGRARGRQAIRKPADLQRRPLIHSEVNLYGWRDWLREHPGVALDLERGPRFDRSFMAISAAVDGLGVALESALLVERELDAGRLVLPFGREGPRLVCHSAVALKSSARLPKMQAFNSWLFEELGRSLAGETQPA
jgi:LysR family transcriptional regulator, glycine cleavage system transcriptional activator